MEFSTSSDPKTQLNRWRLSITQAVNKDDVLLLESYSGKLLRQVYKRIRKVF